MIYDVCRAGQGVTGPAGRGRPAFGRRAQPVFCRPAATPLTVSSSSRSSRSRSGAPARSAARARSCRCDSASTYGSRRATARDSTGRLASSRSCPVTSSTSRRVRSYSASTAADRSGRAAEVQVAAGDLAVGLGQAHLRVVQQDREQRPGLVGGLHGGQPARAVRRRGQPAAQAEPARQVDPGLRPGEHPRDRPQLVQAGLVRADPAAGRPGPDPQPADLLQRADAGQPPGEPVGPDQGPVGGQRRFLHPAGELAEPLLRRCAGRRAWPGGGQQHRGGHLLQVPPGDDRVAVPGEDHLALLGDLEPAVHRARRLGQHRPPGRAAAPAQRPAAAVEQGQPDPALARPRRSSAAGPRTAGGWRAPGRVPWPSRSSRAWPPARRRSPPAGPPPGAAQASRPGCRWPGPGRRRSRRAGSRR